MNSALSTTVTEKLPEMTTNLQKLQIIEMMYLNLEARE